MSGKENYMENDRSGNLINEIGINIKGVAQPTGTALLYAEVDYNVVGASIFVNRGDHLECLFPDDDLDHTLLDLWDERTSDPAWVALEYLVQGSRFKMTYTYADNPDWDGELDRRERVVKRYFGDKPIVYPPLPSGVSGLTYKL